MTEVSEDGLVLIEGDEVTKIHTSGPGDDDLETLRDYLEEWEIEL